MSVLILQDKIFEGSDFDIVAAIAVAIAGQEDEVLIVTSDLAGTITLDIFERGVAAAIYSENLVAADVLFNTPQLDAFWKHMDDVGYNFRKRIAMADLAPVVLKGGKQYRCVVRVPTSNDGVLKVVANATIEATEV